MIRNLRFWCQKVLPLVYDDSLSYYELLCKVVAKLNEVIDTVNLRGEDIKNEVDRLLTEWIKTGKLAEMIDNYGLFSNSLDIEYLASLVMPDSRYDAFAGQNNYEVIQGLCELPNGNLAVIRTDVAGKTDTQMVEFYTKKGIAVPGAQLLIPAGHGNDITCDGSFLYVCWSVLNTDQSVLSNKVTKINVDLSSYEIITLPVSHSRSLQYDAESDTFISATANTVSVLSADLQTVIKTVTLDESKIYNHEKFPDMARQHNCIYNGMVGVCYSYPAVIAFYSLETGALLKCYNIPDTSFNGFSLRETEGLYFSSDGYFYGTAFARYGIGDICGNVFFRTSPTKGAIDGDPAYTTRDNRRFDCYVDPTISGNSYQDGTSTHPFKYLQNAVDYAKHSSICHWIIIKSSDSPQYAGGVQMMNANNIWITHDGERDNVQTVPEIIIRDCSNVHIFLQNCGKIDADFSSGVHVVNCTIATLAHFNRINSLYFTSCTVPGDVTITSSIGCYNDITPGGTENLSGFFRVTL